MISHKHLPSGWVEAALRDVAEVNPPNPTELPADDALVSFVPMASVEVLSGRLDASDIRPWSQVRKGYTRFQDGDVLFAKITPCMENGKAAVARGLAHGVASGSTEFHVLRPAPGLRAELLLHYVLQEEFRKAARAQMTGTAGQLRVPGRFLNDQTVPLPPAPEQHRIVDALESYFTRLDAAVATLERVQRNLKRYRASVLKAAVEGRLVPTEAELARAEGRTYESASVLLERILAERRRRWEEAELAKMQAKGKALKDDTWKAKYVEPVAPETSGLPELPEGWCWTTLRAVAECLDSQRVPVSKRERAKRPGRVPYYGANGQTGWIDHPLFNEPLVLVVEDETFTGRTEPFSYLIEGPAWVNNHAHVLRLLPPSSTQYLNYSLMFYPFIPLTTGTTARRKLTQKMLMSAPYPLPPAEEQRRIVREVEFQLSIWANTSSDLTSQRSHLDRLRQSILKWAFDGRLVDQDPTDEPASALLERIRAERLAARSAPGGASIADKNSTSRGRRKARISNA